MLLSAYRRDDYADPEAFVAQLGVVLEKYPEWVVRYVTSPETGIQRRQTFPPSIAEVVSACEDIYGGERFAQEWDERSRRQIEERRALPNWARTPSGRPTVTWKDVEEMQKEGKKVHIYGAFDRDRDAPYRG